MPQSLSLVLVHLVFSTKNREPWIRASIESELYAYGTTVLINEGSPALTMNGTADHIHVLFQLSRVKTIADVVETLKTSTSKWVKTKGQEYRGFHWQNGYGAFSVSQSGVERAISYIRQQKRTSQRAFVSGRVSRAVAKARDFVRRTVRLGLR
jgi:REP element-mobilizing transposase RayT